MVRVRIPSIRKQIVKFRRLWSVYNKNNRSLRINNLDPLETLILINRESAFAGLTPIGLTVQFTLDIGCNANCIMCDKRIMKKQSNQTYDRLSRLVDFLDNETVSRVKLLGGEPLLDRRGLLDLLKRCSAKGIRMHLITNGFLLSKRYADLLIKNGLDRITLSLDSGDSREHDALRGLPGSFDRIISVIKYMKHKYPKFGISVNSVAMRSNIGSLKRIIALINELGVNTLNVIFPEDFGRNFQRIALTRSDRVKVDRIRYSAEVRRSRAGIVWDVCNPKYDLGCRFRFSQMSIHEDGEVTLCGKYPLKRSVAINKPIAALLQEKDLRRFFQDDTLHCHKIRH